MGAKVIYAFISMTLSHVPSALRHHQTNDQLNMPGMRCSSGNGKSLLLDVFTFPNITKCHQVS